MLMRKLNDVEPVNKTGEAIQVRVNTEYFTHVDLGITLFKFRWWF